VDTTDENALTLQMLRDDPRCRRFGPASPSVMFVSQTAIRALRANGVGRRSRNLPERSDIRLIEWLDADGE